MRGSQEIGSLVGWGAGLPVANCGLADVLDLPAALAEFHRCLKPGGYLWVAEGVFRGERVRGDAISEDRTLMRPAFDGALTIDAFVQQCLCAGFARAEVSDAVSIPAGELALPGGCASDSLVMADIKVIA